MSECSAKVLPAHQERSAVVYVRQSSQYQVANNLESQRRQYDLVARAKELGFVHVETIDDDLGRSGSGLVERPGFARLVAMVCSGTVGAVLSLEASRLARNGRDWHQLIELCGFSAALVIDAEGIYDPRQSNDRLLLGLKGTMSEFELSLFRQRSEQAIRQKAQRGELQFCLPIGYVWSPSGMIEFDPDLRVRSAIASVFEKFEEMGSARQVLLWFRGSELCLPARGISAGVSSTQWKPPIYNSVLKILTNPLYAGAYAYGKTEVRIAMKSGRAEKTGGHRKLRDHWTALIRDHHEAYISWEQHERILAIIARNTHMRGKMGPTGGRGGRSLLAGLLRCRRCGRMLHVAYSGTKGNVPRYGCRGANINHGTAQCISLGGLRMDAMVAHELITVISPHGITAAVHAQEQIAEGDRTREIAINLELQDARYQATLAERRYEASDPENRLVTSALEVRWNHALERLARVQQTMEEHKTAKKPQDSIKSELLMTLANDFSRVWNDPGTPMRLKQRIAQILLVEVLVDIDEQRNELVALLHWKGGRHSELRIPKNKTGRRLKNGDCDATDVLVKLSGRFSDDAIASILNRLRLRTGSDNSWTEGRVKDARRRAKLPAFDPQDRDSSSLTLEQAARHLGVSPTFVRRLIARNVLSGEQVVPYAPWLISAEELSRAAVLEAVKASQGRRHRPQTVHPHQTNLDFASIASGGA
jgi:DNA invertase Pin-like site-specific DNA recombinase